ncbi:MAG: thermonuclease family protein, partial [Clostridia bacterium]|nr:thermonuclease family protein [Clostridia bacterium]
ARYLAINTPESTGNIEEYGKAASNYTREKLSSATSIILESDDGKWNVDSTGGRYLVWVWYKTADSEDYKNLNVEILQNGLAIASSSANNRYGDICMDAIAQAKAQKLNVYSGKQDPDFYYGDAVELTLKELRCNIENYNGIKVAVEGVITKNNANSVYIEEYDPETGLYYGISIYYGYGLNGDGLNILSVGNRSRIVGTVQYYEAGGTYQVSGLTYRQMKPKDPGNIQKISEGHSPAYVLTLPSTFKDGKVELELEDGAKSFDYAYLALNSSISMENLVVKEVYTTMDEESSSYGAMTLTCEVDGVTVSVRTVVLFDENGDMITADKYEGMVIDVRGIVDCYDGEYQIKVLSTKDITIKN